uniref:Protein kinase domain-containing protein n=1 Tax=Oryza rufipogon TaxID=4529 RepID=A0A0E0NAA9_ORYRU
MPQCAIASRVRPAEPPPPRRARAAPRVRLSDRWAPRGQRGHHVVNGLTGQPILLLLFFLFFFFFLLPFPDSHCGEVKYGHLVRYNPSPPPLRSCHSPTNSSPERLLSRSFELLGLALLGFLLGWDYQRRATRQQSSQHNDDPSGDMNITKFTYKELSRVTENFSPSNKIGEGGFGSVYKGKLRNGKLVAVKVLSLESRQGAKEFLNELMAISNVSHENLVKLYGYCVEGNQRILVYNYLENNSLAQTLLGYGHSNIQFNWATRVNICVGIARGLTYLHEVVNPHIVHRDIKASNILLDKDLTPKISDFGLAKLLPPDASHVSTRVAGTLGYLAPEYAIRGQVTRKSDVYSFGVLLLEIVSGRSNTNTRLPYEDQILLERFPEITNGVLLLQTWVHYEEGDLEKIIDASLGDDLDVAQACMFLKIGLLCTQDVTKHRPTMSMVVRMLTGEMDVELAKISKPAIISDFMDLKVRSMRKEVDIVSSSTSTLLSSIMAHSSPLLSQETTEASMTFTAISDRE